MNIQSEAAEWEDAVNSDRAKFVLRPASFPHVATLVLVTEDGDGRSSERLVALFAQMDPGLVVLAAMGAATGAEIESKIEGHEPPEIRKRKSKKQSKRRPKADVPKPEPKPEPPTKPAPQPETAAAEPEPKPHTEVAPTSKPAPAVKLKPRKPARAPKPKPAPTRHAVMLWLVKANPGITVTALQDRPELEGYGAVGRQTRKDISSGKLTGSATEGLYLGAPGRPIASEGAPVDALAAAFQNSADAPSATARVVSVVAEAGPVDRARLREIFEETLPTVQRQINKLIANGRLAVSVTDESIEVTPEGLKYLKAS